jgi:hypothetical protein
MMRLCRKCGGEFWGEGYERYCPDCRPSSNGRFGPPWGF